MKSRDAGYMLGPKHVASHTIKHDVFDENCFIILVLKFNTSGWFHSILVTNLMH